MNKTEELYYWDYLHPRTAAETDEPKILKIYFEKIRFILVQPDHETKRKESTYTPDFYCVREDGEMEIHEVKGFMDEADRLKVKMAADQFPEFHWYMARSLKKGQFKVEEF